MELREKIALAFYRQSEVADIDTDDMGECEALADRVLAIPEIAEALRCRDWAHAAALQQELGKPA